MSVGVRRWRLGAPALILMLSAFLGFAPHPARAQAGDCTILGTEGPDLLTGTPDDDVICGLGDNDHLVGGAGNDLLRGGNGDDFLEGGVGNDTVSGGAGVDLLYGNDGDDVLQGEEDTDYLEGDLGADQLDGGLAADTCPVGPGDVQISCTRANPADPNDANGAADLSRMIIGFDQGEPTWTFQTFATFTIKGARDHAYFLVYLDTAGDPGAEFYGLLRSGGVRMLGELYRANGTFVTGVGASKPGGNTVRIRIPKSRLALPAGRNFVRWYGQSLYVGDPCPNTCFDRIPGSDWLIRPLL
jgi:hypothetical protein